jgi:hypothetical protein
MDYQIKMQFIFNILQSYKLQIKCGASVCSSKAVSGNIVLDYV